MHTQWIAIAVAALAVITVVVIFNRLVRSRNLVREAWSGIDVQLKRRSDLVPSLVETVKGYAAHERALFAEIVEKRNSAMGAVGVTGKAAAESELQGSLRRLLAVAEAYPELKASQNFVTLQQQLSDLEDQLQMARRYYNGTVRDYNIAIQTFPDMLVARLLGYREENFFQVDEAAKATPSIGFGGKPS